MSFCTYVGLEPRRSGVGHVAQGGGHRNGVSSQIGLCDVEKIRIEPIDEGLRGFDDETHDRVVLDPVLNL